MAREDNLYELPEGLPIPVDDGASAHLPGMRLPSVPLRSTAGNVVSLMSLTGRTVVYCYGVVAVPVQDPAELPAESVVRVSIQDNFFVPADALVAPGTTVEWVNEGNNPHSVVADDGQFNSGMLNPGDRFMVTFYGSGTLT